MGNVEKNLPRQSDEIQLSRSRVKVSQEMYDKVVAALAALPTKDSDFRQRKAISVELNCGRRLVSLIAHHEALRIEKLKQSRGK